MSMAWKLLRFGCVLLLLAPIVPVHAQIGSVQVLDAQSSRPIAGALVTVASKVGSANSEGVLDLSAPAPFVSVRAPGYRRMELRDEESLVSKRVIRLQPFTPKAVYLSVYGIGDRHLREAALQLVARTELNALVIDVKGDRGGIPYRSGVALVSEVGAQKVITVRDMPALLDRLHKQGIYTVARVVAFKDNLLARSRPELAVHTRSGMVWTDREGLAWSDPFRHEVWDYVIDIAEEAAHLGFDEIQFDYLRFPDEPGLVFSKPSTEANRLAAISGFLIEARERLAPYNVFLAADIFGYVLWNTNDTYIGQRLEDLAPYVDYISPMLYPSGFQYGIPGYPNPVAAPHEIVDLSLRNARRRTRLPGIRFRPWLQAFRDYAFDRRIFGADEIKVQIQAAEAFGADGWMLWNPHNVYGEAGLKRRADQ